MNIIQSAREGKLDKNLLRTQELRNIIKSIRSSIKDFDFPIDGEYASTDELTQVATTRMGYLKNKLIVEITIPLLERYPYEAYRMHPLPVKQDVTSEGQTIVAYIEPKAKIIAVCTDHGRFTFMTQFDYNECTRYNRKRICTYTEQARTSHAKEICEYSLLHNAKVEDIQNCKITALKSQKEIWIRLEEADEWLFSIPKEIAVHVRCPSFKFNIAHLKGMGIFRIGQSCTAAHDDTEIIGSQVLGMSKSDYHMYAPNISLDILSIDQDLFKKAELIQEHRADPVGSGVLFKRESLREVEEKYKQITEHLRYKSVQKKMSVRGISLSLLSIIIITIVIIILLKMCRSEGRVTKETILPMVINVMPTTTPPSEKKEFLEDAKEKLRQMLPGVTL